MKKIFLDDNIILDYLINTRGQHKEAVDIISNVKENEVFCYSFGSISDIAYIYENTYKLDKKEVIGFYEDLSKSSKFESLSLSDKYLEKSCEYALKQITDNKKLDFEDVLQYFCALENSCSVIITNDKNFPQLDISLIRTNPKLENYTPNKASGILDNVKNLFRKNI